MHYTYILTSILYLHMYCSSIGSYLEKYIISLTIIYLSSINQSICLSSYPSIHLSIYPFTNKSIYLSIYMYLSINPPIQYIYPLAKIIIYPIPCYLSIYQSIHLFIHLYIYPPIYQLINISIYLHVCIYSSNNPDNMLTWAPFLSSASIWWLALRISKI